MFVARRTELSEESAGKHASEMQKMPISKDPPGKKKQRSFIVKELLNRQKKIYLAGTRDMPLKKYLPEVYGGLGYAHTVCPLISRIINEVMEHARSIVRPNLNSISEGLSPCLGCIIADCTEGVADVDAWT